jgi:hypothetical protein
MANCNICPRKCNVDRNVKTGVCGVSDTLKIARAALHFWEEPCISGTKGSGTVFFSGCNMKCIFCQNYEISTGGFGKEITTGRLREIYNELIERGTEHFPIELYLVDKNHPRYEMSSHWHNEIELMRIISGKLNVKLNSNEYLTEEILSANSISKMAELTAAEIYDIRESKNAIMKGQVETMPKDGASLKIVIDELEKHEAALMQLFIGYEERGSEIKTFNYIPSEDEENKLLFRHSGKLGFVDNDDLAGNAYMIDVKNLHTTPIVEENPKEKKKLNGVMYNMPSLANVKIYTAQQTYLEKKIPVAQYGNEDILTNTLFNKGATTKVVFNHATGAIEKIEQ